MSFISTWTADQITLPLVADGTYDFVAHWGDDSSSHITTYDQSDVTHNYGADGTYQVTIDGTIIGWRFAGEGDCEKITGISQWGILRLGNSGEYFHGCRNLEITATDSLDLTGTTTLYQAFAWCDSLTTLDVSNWDVSGVTNFRELFVRCEKLQSLIGEGNWDTSSATTLRGMFAFCYPLTSLDVTTWNVSNVTDFRQCFFDCRNLSTLDVSNWNTSNATTMGSMFQWCEQLNTLHAENWDISNVASLAYFAYGGNLSTTCYDLLLINWSEQEVQDGLTVHFGGSRYTEPPSEASEARSHLESVHHWTIYDGGHGPTIYAEGGAALGGLATEKQITTPLEITAVAVEPVLKLRVVAIS